eukprot:COSAG02_NODE_2911_length_7765_cov_39.714975_5_plen_164_part_00
MLAVRPYPTWYARPGGRHVDRHGRHGRPARKSGRRAPAPRTPPAPRLATFDTCTIFMVEPWGLPAFRRQSNFRSAAQSDSRLGMDSRLGRNFQLKFRTRNAGRPHGSEASMRTRTRNPPYTGRSRRHAERDRSGTRHRGSSSAHCAWYPRPRCIPLHVWGSIG